ncbi:MAG: apolipoprotein N-acyltransferase [Bacteroidetes bacterium GWE2_29_8]|nr:MAG: apolipoprotein N-acyltransferase [Bacteroidetes bacterium GWE2_29_8]OFY22572.1 MAG: apolipoprotein N-acyltransferase [Bacteroidetes bacterium GWF2_29_10]
MLKSLFIVILTSTLLSIGWTTDLSLFLLVAFVPLFYFEENNDNLIKIKKGKNLVVFLIFHLCFFLWNFITTSWLQNATFWGGFMAIFFNSLFMAIIFFMFYIKKNSYTKILRYVYLVSFWLIFEYAHHNWDLSWVWLTLGNGFAGTESLIQWYEFTGVFGGTLWILVTNIIAYEFFKNKKLGLSLSAIIFIPLLISISIYSLYKETVNPIKIVVVQPNIDPYNEKFSDLSTDDQYRIFIKLGKTLTDQETDYIIGPETALPGGYWVDSLNTDLLFNYVSKSLCDYPKLKLITGISTYKHYTKESQLTATSKEMGDGTWYDSYNSAVQTDCNMNISLYHKSKLVSGVELMPYPELFKFLERFALDLGGTSGSLGTQKERSVFIDKTGKFKVAPIICYESVFGEYVTGYVKNGATFLAIITNDGWWGDTWGYKQHLLYAKLRAIENRRSIARSANTGISCFINQKGNIILQTKYWEKDVIKGKINNNTKITFYTQFGDFIPKISIFIFFALMFSSRFKIFRKTN